MLCVQIRGMSMGGLRAGDVAGCAGAGVVTSVSAGEREFAVNDSVLVIGSGTWTNDAIVSTSSVSKLSSKVSAEEAAALPAFVSAWAILHEFAALKSGDLVVQTNGSSAVGAAITQLGKALGLKVVSLSDADLSGAKLTTTLQEVGKCKLAVSGQSGRHLTALQKALANSGVAVAYSGVFESLQSSADVQLPISNIIFNDASVRGFELVSWVRGNTAAYRKSVAALMPLVQEGKLTLKPAHVFPQADYLKAIEEVTARGSSVVLKH